MFKNKRMGRLMIALAALVVSLIMTVTATYAWFTFNSTVSLSDIDLSTNAGRDLLQINVDQVDTAALTGTTLVWSTNLGYTANLVPEINKLLTTKAGSAKTVADFKLGAFSTDNGTAFVNTTNTALTAADFTNICNSVDGGILEFKINFRANRALSVGLDNGSKVSTPNNTLPAKFISAWGTIAQDTYGTHAQIALNSKIYLSAAYAVRYAFVGTSTKIWNPESTAGSFTATGTKKGSIDDTRAAATLAGYYVFEDSKVSGTVNFAHDFYKSIMSAWPTRSAATIAPAAVLAFDAANAAGTANSASSLVTLAASGDYFYGQVTVRVWLEGTDTSCTNAILSDSFLTNLVFTVIGA